MASVSFFLCGWALKAVKKSWRTAGQLGVRWINGIILYRPLWLRVLLIIGHVRNKAAEEETARQIRDQWTLMSRFTY